MTTNPAQEIRQARAMDLAKRLTEKERELADLTAEVKEMRTNLAALRGFPLEDGAR